MTNIGILGYGNLGKGVELAASQNDDINLVAIFTRRDPKDVKTLLNTKVLSIKELDNYQDKIDVLIICGGSATDLPVLTPKYAERFNIIDSFDTHANIPTHFKNVNDAALKNNHLALISCGWDPGLFSLNRLMAESILPEGNSYTFWGKGVSQGHSDAIRRIEGVKRGIQYTIPIDKAIEQVRNGENPELTTRQKHLRECFVVLEADADPKIVENEIKTMPNYFADYDTIVHFIDEEEFNNNHNKMPHGGFVIRSGKTGVNKENNQIIEYSLKLDSNPEFTSSVLVCYARAIHKMYQDGMYGCKTIFDIPPVLLTKKTSEELLHDLL